MILLKAQVQRCSTLADKRLRVTFRFGVRVVQFKSSDSYIVQFQGHLLSLSQLQRSFVKGQFPFARIAHVFFFTPTMSFSRIEFILDHPSTFFYTYINRLSLLLGYDKINLSLQNLIVKKLKLIHKQLLNSLLHTNNGETILSM